MTSTRAQERPAMLSVYDGRHCVGFILARGREGFEAFGSDAKSRGLFSTQREAAAALSPREAAA